jgi:hypothetical protein
MTPLLNERSIVFRRKGWTGDVDNLRLGRMGSLHSVDRAYDCAGTKDRLMTNRQLRGGPMRIEPVFFFGVRRPTRRGHSA